MLFPYLKIKITLERDKKKIGKSSWEYTDKGFFVEMKDICCTKAWYEPINNDFVEAHKRMFKRISN